MSDPRGLAPAGWHVPSDDELSTLEKNLGRFSGTQLKSRSGWDDNINSNNLSAISGLPGGYRVANGSYALYGLFAYWWSSTENKSATALGYFLNSFGNTLSGLTTVKGYGYSVRCVRD